jgi:hypothetical protein
MSYTKDEALWYAINQMRRAARVLEIASIMINVPDRIDESYAKIYAKGLDQCADMCEETMDQDELKKLKAETFPDYCPTCGRSGAAREANETDGVDICYDEWHERVKA